VHFQVGPVPVDPEHVLIEQVAQHGALLLQRPLDGVQLIAQLRRPLELEQAGGALHPLVQLRAQLVGLALEEQRHLVHRALVFLGRDGVDARRGAALDLVLQAGPPPVGHHLIGAGAQLEVAVDEAQRLADGRGARIGSK